MAHGGTPTKHLIGRKKVETNTIVLSAMLPRKIGGELMRRPPTLCRPKTRGDVGIASALNLKKNGIALLPIITSP